MKILYEMRDTKEMFIALYYKEKELDKFHIHIIPRKINDGIDAWPGFEGAKEDIHTVFERVKM